MPKKFHFCIALLCFTLFGLSGRCRILKTVLHENIFLSEAQTSAFLSLSPSLSLFLTHSLTHTHSLSFFSVSSSFFLSVWVIHVPSLSLSLSLFLSLSSSLTHSLILLHLSHTLLNKFFTVFLFFFSCLLLSVSRIVALYAFEYRHSHLPGPQFLSHAVAHSLKRTFAHRYFKVGALIKKIYISEKSSQPTKRANKVLVLIFFTMMATILDTHGTLL